MISGFTFIKNGLTLGYPFLESAKTIEPLCKEVIINVGFEDEACTKDDGTYEYLRDNLNNSKFKFIKSWWDPNVSSQGLILSQQTNIALAKCNGKTCQYIQGDEAVHEKDLINIEEGHRELINRNELHGLIFNYIHFYGNTDVYRHTRSVYRREVRAIKNNHNITSWKDAQGFRFNNGTKINAKLIDARIFHYGWARPQEVMNEKIKSFDKLYHGKEHEQEKEFNYRRIWGLKRFHGKQPSLLNSWVNENTHPIDILSLPKSYRIGDWDLAVSDLIETYTGYRIGEYKNYKLIK
jgi:hypothetical protein